MARPCPSSWLGIIDSYSFKPGAPRTDWLLALYQCVYRRPLARRCLSILVLVFLLSSLFGILLPFDGNLVLFWKPMNLPHLLLVPLLVPCRAAVDFGTPTDRNVKINLGSRIFFKSFRLLSTFLVSMETLSVSRIDLPTVISFSQEAFSDRCQSLEEESIGDPTSSSSCCRSFLFSCHLSNGDTQIEAKSWSSPRKNGNLGFVVASCFAHRSTQREREKILIVPALFLSLSLLSCSLSLCLSLLARSSSDHRCRHHYTLLLYAFCRPIGMICMHVCHQYSASRSSQESRLRESALFKSL